MQTNLTQSAEVMALFCRLKMKVKAELPIRSSEMGVLIYVHKSQEPVTPLMISHFFKISKPSATSMINALLIQGFLCKESIKQDRRSYTLKITDLGCDLIEKTISEHYRAIETMMEKMGNESFSQFIHLMHRANVILEDLEQ